jgi:hypothetical protein
MTDTEYVSAAEAAAMLGTTPQTLTRMLHDGTLAWEVNPLDKRGKIIKRSDVLKLAAKRPAKMPPRKEVDAA